MTDIRECAPREPGYVIRDASIVLGSYLERTPYDGSYSWLAGTVTYATVFSKEAAEAMAAKLRAEGQTVLIEPDYCRRAPEITSAEQVAA